MENIAQSLESVPFLPHELLDEIISHNWNDPYALRATSLVSRTCHLFSHAYLFSCVQLFVWSPLSTPKEEYWGGLRGHSCQNLHRLLVMSPHVAKWVVALHIYVGSPQNLTPEAQYLQDILAVLHNVRRFLMSGGQVVLDWDDFPTPLQTSLAEFWQRSSLEAFIADGISMAHSTRLQTSRGQLGWTRLRHLSLLWTDLDYLWEETDGAVIPLESLTLGGLQVMAHLISAVKFDRPTFDVRGPRGLRVFNAIMDSEEHDLDHLNTFLSRSSGTLEELCLDISLYVPRSKFEFCPLPKLKLLRLVLQGINSGFSPCGELPSSLQSIQVMVIVEYYNMNSFSPWCSLDNWVGNQLDRLPNLRSVDVDIHVAMSACSICLCKCAPTNGRPLHTDLQKTYDHVLPDVRADMPLLGKKGILTVAPKYHRIQWGGPGSLPRWISLSGDLYKAI